MVAAANPLINVTTGRAATADATGARITGTAANRSGDGTLHDALRLANLGWSMLPLHEAVGGICSCHKAADCGGSTGKHPRTAHGTADATTGADVIRGWLTKWPGANLAIATGAEQGVFMVGPDGAGGRAALAELVRQHGPLPRTPRARSGSADPGEHYYFSYPAGAVITNARNHRGLPIDVRGDGGLAVAPPSWHKSGRRYEWIVPPWETPLAEAPAWLVEWCQKEHAEASPPPSAGTGASYGAAGPDVIRRALAYLEKCLPAISGSGGHNQTFAVARAIIYGFDLGPETGYQLLAEHYNPRCQPPWSEKELRHKCEQADTKPCQKPRGWLLEGRGPAPRIPRPSEPKDAGGGLHEDGTWQGQGAADDSEKPDAEPHLDDGIKFTDWGNARRLVHHHGDDLRHCFPWRKDLVWERRHWKVDDTGEMERRAKDTIRRIYTQAAEEQNEDLRKALVEWAVKSENAMRIHNIIALARSEPGIPILPSRLNNDPMLLNVANGTLDLRTGKLHKHRRQDYLTKLCPVEYDPGATCPTWERFLTEIFPATGDTAEQPGNTELIRFVQRFLGYCLTGDIREQILAIFWGNGSNGKSTMLNVLLELLGQDYAIKAPPNLLMAKREAHPTEKADLFGQRLVTTIETEDGGRLAEALVKDLTGGDHIRARRMREDFWQFAPTHKLVLCTNHKPKIRGTDHAIWRRIRLVPFTVRFEGDRKDAKLPDKLRAEYPGILAWLVRGCLDWQKDDLGLPEAVKQATQEYRAEQDLVAGFVQECCVEGDAYRCRAGELYARFKHWTEACGEAQGSAVPSQRMFGLALSERGFERYTNNGTWYRGIGLRHDHEEEIPE
jgi:putative DNA primase/helicase